MSAYCSLRAQSYKSKILSQKMNQSDEAEPLFNQQATTQQEQMEQVRQLINLQRQVPDYTKSQLRIIAGGYCDAMKAGPSCPIYDSVRHFQKNMRQSTHKASVNHFYSAFYSKLPPEFGHNQSKFVLKCQQIVHDIESLDEDNLWLTIFFFKKYHKYTTQQKFQQLRLLNNKQLLELREKLMCCSKRVQGILPFSKAAVNLNFLCEAISSEAISEKKIMLHEPSKSLWSVLTSFATGFGLNKDLIKGKSMHSGRPHSD